MPWRSPRTTGSSSDRRRAGGAPGHPRRCRPPARRPPSGERGRFPSPPRPPTRLIGREREVAEIAFALRSGRSPPGDADRPGRGRQDAPGHRRGRGDRGGIPGRRRLGRAGPYHRPPEAAASRVAARHRPRAGDPRTGAASRSRRSLAAAIGSRKLLLVLDNFEHLLAAAPLVADLSWRPVRRWPSSRRAGSAWACAANASSWSSRWPSDRSERRPGPADRRAPSGGGPPVRGAGHGGPGRLCADGGERPGGG